MSPDVIVYHTGLLARDRAEDPELHIRAQVFWGRYLLGEGTLAQRLLPSGAFDYLFIPRRPRR